MAASHSPLKICLCTPPHRPQQQLLCDEAVCERGLPCLSLSPSPASR